MNSNDVPKIKGERLRQRRMERKLSQEDVSELAGLNQSTVSQLEREEQIPTVRSLVSLSKVLDVSIEWLLGLTDDMKPATINSEDLDDLEQETIALLRQSKVTDRGELVNILRSIVLLTTSRE